VHIAQVVAHHLFISSDAPPLPASVPPPSSLQSASGDSSESLNTHSPRDGPADSGDGLQNGIILEFL